MKNSESRRKFMKSMQAVPFIASCLNSLATETNTKAVSKKFGHKLKLSLNLYSFNSLLMEKKIDLFDVLDFCAEYNFDAIDPTGYYFPGYPEVPTDFINLFKIIKDGGYRGYLPLETLGAGDPYQKVPVLLENLRKALQ